MRTLVITFAVGVLLTVATALGATALIKMEFSPSRVWCQKCTTATTCIDLPLVGRYCFDSTTCQDIPCPDFKEER